jgi:hypothetical protein
MGAMISLDAIEARLLGVLVEKQMTTPDVYPLTLAGVVAGANQSTNREPVMSLDETTAESALSRLHEAGLASPVRRSGDRAIKYRHKLTETLELEKKELALLSVLLLRGTQTPGELRQRTERYVPFDSIDDLETTLDVMEERGLVMRLARQPGQSQRRVVELLSDRSQPPVRDQPAPPTTSASDRLAVLEARFDELLTRLGVDDI